MMAAINTATSESRRGRASPWNQVVRGGESEPEPTVSGEPSSSPTPSPPIAEDSAGDGAGGWNAGKRQAWNKQPPNGGSEAGPVMGAESWPALGESARVSTKSSSESLKGLSDGVPSGSSSQVLSQVSGTTVSTTTTSPRKQAPSTSTQNHSAPVRQKSMKQRNNPNASSNGGLPQQQELASQAYENISSNPLPKESTPRSGFGHHSHGSGDSQQRNSFRHRNGSGPHVRGDGPHHHNYGARRDQDRGNHEWNSQNRSFNGRDSHIQQQRMPRPIRGPPPPPSPPPFIPHLGMRPYGPPPPMPYPGELGAPLFYIHHPSFVAPVPPIIVHGPDPQLPSKIASQIDYYFSNENLIKDEYLRRKMNKDGGWIPIDVIARFKKVSDLTDNIPFILDALRLARNVEVQGDQIRKRSDWNRWIIVPANEDNVKASKSQTPGRSGDDNLVARVQGITLEERNVTGDSSQSNHQPQVPNGDSGSDSSFFGRN